MKCTHRTASINPIERRPIQFTTIYSCSFLTHILLSCFLLFRSHFNPKQSRATHTVGMSLAWTFTSIRVAFASSLQGGMMMARSGLVALKKRNIDVEGMVTNPKHKELVDDYAAYVFAGLGFLFQLYFRLTPPFPLNIILFPFRIAEWALRYGVMKMSSIV